MAPLQYRGIPRWEWLMKCAKSFCLQTSIHGFNHIAAPKRHWIERLLWICVLATALWGVLDVSLGQWQRYRENPTVVTLEKNFRTWHYIMPGITACEQNRTTEEKVQKAIKSRWNAVPGDDKFSYYGRFVDLVANSDLHHLEGYKEFANDTDLNVDLFQLAIDVMPEQRVKLSAADQITTLPKWIPVMTEVGACYAINSLALTDVAIVKPTSNETSGIPNSCKYSSQGCFYIFEYANLINYYVHSAYDIADTLSAPYSSYASLLLSSTQSTTETRTGPGVRELPPSRRHCHYTDEPTEPHRQVHSTKLCQQGCKSRLAVKMCGCKPFYYFNEEGPLCNTSGMWCMAQISHILATFGNIKCPCVQQCLDSIFREDNCGEQIWAKGPLMYRGVIGFTVQPPRMRYTRNIVFHFQDLVVSFGGATGLFLGASFISFVEIGYFVIERILRTGADKPKIAVRTPKAPYENRIQELTSILEGLAYERRYRR
ncbi:uncharacterized protein LOC120635032 [Pararge aegeria]|uniref:uncharacterized protein LOC120635032 n=1 Tax=Pararge aegeria TaxID=116150 RepID=UPI0019D2B013|nr:uncharacterized protein LOC120635032 [Pararge aegeria]